MSKIIKAFQLTQIKSFDFREIERQETLPDGAGRPEQPEGPPPVESNPAEDLENAVQERLAEAKRKAQELEKEGYKKGYEQGRQEGHDAGLKAMTDARERLERVVLELQGLPGKVLHDYRNWFIGMVLAVARQVVHQELRSRPDLLVELIELLLAEAEKDQNMTLYLNPLDLETIEKYAGQSDKFRISAGPLQLKADPTLAVGGCRLESDMQLLDASIESRFAAIEKMLLTQQGPSEDEPAH